MEEDPFYQFVRLYERGEFLKALQTIISYPDVAYDSILSSQRYFRYLVNYADAVVFKGHFEARATNVLLRQLIESDPSLRVTLANFLNLLIYEESLLASEIWEPQKLLLLDDTLKDLRRYEEVFKERESSFSDQDKARIQGNLDSVLHAIPAPCLGLIQQKLTLLNKWEQFSQSKYNLAQLMVSQGLFQNQPWHLFSYPLSLQPTTFHEPKGIPIIFMEPLEQADYGSFLHAYLGKPFLLLFETLTSFSQHLQFSSLIPILRDPLCYIYVLDLYPLSQFQAQGLSLNQPIFQPILISERRAFQEAAGVLAEALQQCCIKGNWSQDTPEGNWLYRAAKRVLFRIQEERYGPTRAVALSIEEQSKRWHDPHKGNFPPHVNLGPMPKNYVEELYQSTLSHRKPRQYYPEKKIRLAHVVPQIVDAGHAPTKVIKTLIRNANRERFQLFLICSERFNRHLLEYPIPPYFSFSSHQRGRDTLQLFKGLMVQTFVEDSVSKYELTAQNISKLLDELKIDVAVFHGPDEVNNLCSCYTNTPYRALFEHGTLPASPCYDMAILSTEADFAIQQAKLTELGIKGFPLPFCIDVREDWDAHPRPKIELGFPPDSFIMTTISNHLDTRLSNEMCHAIAEILKSNPQAYYAPMGRIENQARLRTIFAEYGVNNRVTFLGPQLFPSQLARSMELYLNEFPFGSCLGMIDALAAGCPVVSMYDELGPPQARYGATFFGIDKVIKSGKKEDYIGLANRLIRDPDLYQKWSNEAFRQYEKRVNEKNYVHQFEAIIENRLSQKSQ